MQTPVTLVVLLLAAVVAAQDISWIFELPPCPVRVLELVIHGNN